MSKLNALLLILGLTLAACAGTSKPAASPAASLEPSTTALAQRTAATSSPTSRISLSEPTPFATAAAEPASSVIPTPSVATVSTVAAQSPWPRFLRQLDFSVPAGNSYNPRAIAIHPGLGRLYTRTHIPTPDYQGMGTVAVLDVHTGAVLTVVQTGQDDYSEGQLAVDTVHNRVYVVNPDETTCSVLDASSMQVVDTLQGVDRFSLDPENGRLFVAGLAGLHILNLADYTVLREVSVPDAPQFLALAVDAANDRLYLLYRGNSGYVLGIYDATTLEARTTTSLSGPPDDLLPDAKRDRLYLTLNDGERALFWTLDSDGHLLEEQQLGDWTRHTPLALDPVGDRLFLGRDVYNDYGITVRDLKTGQEAADIPLDASPNALAWDSGSSRLFVSQTYKNQVAVVDVGASRACAERGECTLAVFPTAINLVDLAVDPLRSHFYVTDTAGRLHVLDSDTNGELALLPGAGRIAVDSAHGRLYTGGEGADRVRIFDADSLQQTGEIRSRAIPVANAHNGGLYLVQSGIYIASPETMTITGVISDTLPESPGFSPNPAAVDAVVDPGSGRIFAIINNGTPGSNNGNYLYVYDPVTYTKIFTDTERSAIYVDVDPNTGRAYVSRTHLAGRSTSLFDPGQRAYTARLDAVFGALRVDPALGRVYLSDYGQKQGYLLVLDAANLDVLGSVPIAGGFYLRALDPWRDLLYLAADDGQVQVWSATGGRLPAPVEPVSAELPVQQAGQLFLSPDGRTLFAGSFYRSEDGGQSWFRITEGLPDRGVQVAAISPAFSHDRTLFVALMATDEGLGLWKSTDGGRSWRMADAGLSDLALTGLAISPAFPDDGTLFATARKQGLFRSTDGGESWVRLTERYHQDGLYPEPPGLVAVSPTYVQDKTGFAAHYGLQRSTDGGETWSQVFPQNPESLAISPDFAADGTLFGWFGDGGLLRSTDGGETWAGASVGLGLLGVGNGRVIVGPDFATSETLYFIWTPAQPDTPRQFYRSTDAAATWQRLAGEVPQGTTPVDLAADGTAFLALDGLGRLARWPITDLNWQAAALPPVDELTFDRLVLSPDFEQDHTLLAAGQGAGILRSDDAGLTWTDTGFPLRMTSGDGPQPVMFAPDTILVGTVLGLYRSESGGPWLPVGGGLPQGVAVSSPLPGAAGGQEAGANRPLLVLAGAEDERQVFLSIDGGQTWAQPIPTLPVGATADTLLFSPAFAADRTAFYAPSWGKPRRTLDGGAWEEFGPPGDWNFSTTAISPAFDRDGTLFMRLDDNSLWRSTDRGNTWTKLDVPWSDAAPWAVTVGTGYSLPPLTFSPSFAQDGVLLTRAGDAVYRSTDRGGKWSKVLGLGIGLSEALFSPDYAQDGTIYLLQDNTFYQSTDRGQRWQALNPAPWNPGDEVTFRLSPTFARDKTLLAWTLSGQVYDSIDGGQSWRDATAGLSMVRIHELILAPGYAGAGLAPDDTRGLAPDDARGLAYLLPFTPGLYKRLDQGPWLPITASEPSPVPTATPMPTPLPAIPPTPTATPLPARTPAPLTCASEPVRFRAVWQQRSARLGCPSQPAEQVLFAEQPFEHGRMIWDSSTVQIYVLLETGTWQSFDDTFTEGIDPNSDPALVQPEGRVQPVRGFGKVWREQLGGPQAAIGWALAAEQAVNGWRQRFQQGLLVWSNVALEGGQGAGTAYLLYDDGTWEAIASPGP